MDENAESGLSSSFTDLMTSLAVVFILLLCATINNITEDIEQTRSKILAGLQSQLKEFDTKGVKVAADPKNQMSLLVLVPEGLLDFGLNRSEIPPSGIKFLSIFVPKLTDTLFSEEFKDAISSVVVEGHTDSSGSDANNLALSQRRSMAVVSESIEILRKEGSTDHISEKKEHFLRLLSASGRGKQDLVIVNGKEDHQQSRRVVFKIRVRTLAERKLEQKLSLNPS